MADKKNIWVFAFFALLAAVFGAPVLRHPGNWGIGDWDQFLFYAEAGRKSIVEYRQFPLWAPYFCGGNVLFANPQSQFLTPSYLLILIFGSLLGMKLKIFVAIFTGLAGMYLFARERRLSLLAGVFAAAAYQLSGTYFAYAANGQQWIQTFALTPWALLFFDRCRGDRMWAPAAAMALALMWLEGGIYPFPFAVLLLGMYAVLFAEGCAPKMAVRFFLVLGLTLALGAVKFVPFMQAFTGSSRVLPLEAHDIISPRLLFHVFLGASPEKFGGHYHYFEYFGYVGWVVAALAAGSLLRPRASWRWWVVFAVGLFLLLGVSSPVPMWPALHRLPFFSSMHVTSRFRILLAVPVAMLAAGSFDWIEGMLRHSLRHSLRGRWRWGAVVSVAVPAAILALALAEMFAVNRPLLFKAFVNPPAPVKARDGFVQLWAIPRYGKGASKPSWGMYPAALAGVGTVTCYEYFTAPDIGMGGRLIKSGMAFSETDSLYRGEVYVEGGEARYEFWSPRRLVVEARTEKGGEMVVNQTYHRDWQVEVDGRPGRVRPSEWRLLSVEVGPGAHRVEFRHVSRTFIVWGIISGIAWAMCLFLVVQRFKGSKVQK